ncbi:MAG: hypothetical protein Q7T25_12055 [Sideroxyarcus sp.]|nr:hypothetical protein [Sideroxyarcus sp.]
MNNIFLAPAIEEPPFLWLMEMGGRKVGVNQVDGWCMLLDDHPIFFNSEERCALLAPVLEIDEEKFLEFLENSAISNPIYGEKIRDFPQTALLKHIFHSSYSGYWPEKALAWLAIDKVLQQNFKVELEDFMKNKIMPQRSRQIAKKMLNGLSHH